ncbi:MAG: hypothetical protein ABJE47_16170 [bacterium]
MSVPAGRDSVFDIRVLPLSENDVSGLWRITARIYTDSGSANINNFRALLPLDSTRTQPFRITGP